MIQLERYNMKVYLPYPCTLAIMIKCLEEQTGKRYSYDETFKMVKDIIDRFELNDPYFSAQESQEGNLRYVEIPEENKI